MDSEERRLAFLKQVVVSQNTGRSWDNVRLRITTANAFGNTITPELDPLFVDLYEEVLQQDRNQAASIGERRARREPAMLEEIAVTGSRITATPADRVASQYLLEYQIPGRVSVNAENEDKVLPIEEVRKTVELVTRVVPDVDTSAFVEARFTYDDEVPLQRGEVQFYRDGAFIGKGVINAFLPGEQARLPFGQDDRIRVEVRNLEEESREGRGLGRRSVEESRIRYEVTSFHDDVVTLEVLSRLPVSRNDRIDVDIPDGATPPDRTDVDGEAGILLWLLELAPNEKYAINHFYAVDYPRDSRLLYGN